MIDCQIYCELFLIVFLGLKNIEKIVKKELGLWKNSKIFTVFQNYLDYFGRL